MDKVRLRVGGEVFKVSRINILGSRKYGDNGLSVGWDPGTERYFIVVEDSSCEPVYWKPLLGSIEDVRRCFTELGEYFPEALAKQLNNDRLCSSERTYGFDLSDGKFFGNTVSTWVSALRLAGRALSFLLWCIKSIFLRDAAIRKSSRDF